MPFNLFKFDFIFFVIFYIFVCESPKKPKISAAKMTFKLKFIFTKVPSSLSNFTALL